MLLLPLLLALTLDQQPPTNLTSPPPGNAADEGLIIVTSVEGTGTEHPGDTDIVRIRYELWNTDGKMMGKVAAPNVVMQPVAKMIPGWRMAVKKMVAGEHQRAWIPESLGAKGKVSANGMLVIDTELLEIVHQPVTPPDVAAPPADATVTKSGLAYKVLKPGSGTRHPTRRDMVRVHYSGWTTDGKMFDSSIVRGQDAEFPLTQVIAGWTEGLQLMTEGERTRFWIPAKLAYSRREKDKPQGMLVFDIELLSIE